MFWVIEASKDANPVSNLLEKPDISLEEVLDNEYTLQDMKCGNQRVIEFFCKPENLVRLTQLCLTEPETSGDLKTKYKYCHLASEIFCARVDLLTDAFWANDACMELLAKFVAPTFLASQISLNPLLASFFNKVFTSLIAPGGSLVQHVDQVLSFMQRWPEFLDNLIANLDTYGIVECLFCLCRGGSMDNETEPVKLKKWLADGGFLSKVLSQLDASKSPLVHENVAFLLCELIRTLRRNQFDREFTEEPCLDPLVGQLESQSFLDSLLERTFPDDDTARHSESVISSGCTVFLTLLQTVVSPERKLVTSKVDPSSEDDMPRLGVRVPGLFWEPDANRLAERSLASNLSRLKRLLGCKRQDPVQTPMGPLDMPFGRTRLIITQLLVQLLSNSLPMAHEEFVKLDLLGSLLELFFNHKWNNFLHTNVINCCICALYGRLDAQHTEEPSGAAGTAVDMEVDEFGEPVRPTSCASPLLKQLLESHHLLQRIVQALEDCERIKNSPGTSTPSYRGHIMRLSVCVRDASQTGPNANEMRRIMSTLPESERRQWDDFVHGRLLPYMKRNEPDQVGIAASADDGVLTDRTEDVAASAVGNQSKSTEIDASIHSGVAAHAAAVDAGTRNPVNVNAATVDNSEPMEFSVDHVAPESNIPTSINDQDEWIEREITFRPGSLDNANSTTESSSTIPKTHKLSIEDSSDEDEEKMDIEKSDAAGLDWFPADTTSSKNSETENWAKFDEWPSSTTPQGDAAKAVKGNKNQGKESTDSNWANFDKLCSSKNPNLDNMWS